MAAKKPNADKSNSAKLNTGKSKTGTTGGKSSAGKGSSLNAAGTVKTQQQLNPVADSFEAHDPKHRQGHFEGAGEHPRTGTRGK